MNANRKAHYLGLLATLAAQLGGVWASTETDLAAKIAMSIAAGLAVLLPSVWQRKVYPVLLACIPVAVALVAVLKLRVTPGSAAAGFVSLLPAILTRLGALLPVQPQQDVNTTSTPGDESATQVAVLRGGPSTDLQSEKTPKGPDMPKIASVILFIAALGAASQARADISLDTIAPRLTKCWGTSTCLMPAASVNAAMLNLSTKKWEAGTVALGAGLALLFAADTPYASGLVAHLTGVLSQEPGKSSFAMPSIGVLALRYIEVSYSYRMADGEPNTGYLSVAGVVPWDMFTRATIPERAKAARMRAAGLLREGDF